MNGQTAINAVMAFAIALGGQLITLWTGIQDFGDVPPVAYGVALVGAMLVALKDIHSMRADSPANIQQTNDIVAAAANLDSVVVPRDQSGRARTGLLLPLGSALLACLLFAALPACSQYSMTPEKAIAASSLTINELAIQVDQLQKSGQISNEREDQLLDQLKAINGDLRLAAMLTGDLRTQSLESINARLIELRAQLPKQEIAP
jgi:hypothetical protein